MHDIRILTVRQPYASAMFFGTNPKDVENRSQPPPKSLIGKRLYIHAGEALERRGLRLCRDLGFNLLGYTDKVPMEWTKLHPVPHGVILGSVLLDGFTTASESPWRDPSVAYAWILRDPQPLARPVPVPGGGQLTHGWRPTDDVAAQLIEQEYGRAA